MVPEKVFRVQDPSGNWWDAGSAKNLYLLNVVKTASLLEKEEFAE
jgi:hypothetical protein